MTTKLLQKLAFIPIFFLATTFLPAQTIPVWSAQTLEQRLNSGNDTLLVVNFWATWCKPCVEELPLFEKLTKEYSSKKLKVILVSLDFKEEAGKKLKNFVKAKKLKSQVIVIDTPSNLSAWIDSISPEWSGALPATLIVRQNDNVRQFYEKSFKNNDLDVLIQQFFEVKK